MFSPPTFNSFLSLCITNFIVQVIVLNGPSKPANTNSVFQNFKNLGKDILELPHLRVCPPHFLERIVALDESIKSCCDEGDCVYAWFVDVRKAFDKMWNDAMLYKLFHQAGIKGKCWRIIRSWYSNMKEMVYINGIYSRIYDLRQGTRQGGILSPWLFLVYINDLIYELENTCWSVFFV